MMELQLKELDNHTIRLVVTGELSFADQSKFREVFKSVEANKPSHICVDLAGCDFIDSAALGMLLLLKEKADILSADVTIAGAHGQVLKVLELSRFGDLFAMED